MKNLYTLVLLVAILVGTSYRSAAQYCIPSISLPSCNCTTNWDNINNFWTTGGLTNISNLESDCSGNVGNYVYVSDQAVTALPGQTFSIFVQCGNNTTGCSSQFAQGFRIWVDWNNDLDFSDPGEDVWNSGSSGFQVFSGSITVPSYAVGTVRMRVRSSFAGVPPTNACATTSFGEIEEYNIITTPPTPCSGMPNAGGLAQSTNTVVDSATTFSLSTPLPPTYAGDILYQWEMNDGNGWQPIGSTVTNPLLTATNPLTPETDVTGQQTDVQYRLVVTCTNSGLSDTTSAVWVYAGTAGICNTSITYALTAEMFGVQFGANNAAGTGSFAWNFGDGSPGSSLENPSHAYAAAGTYSACVIYNDSAAGCADTACAVVTLTPQSVITGTVYYDANNNNVIDAGEAPMPNVTVYLNAFSAISAQTDANGQYTIHAPAGNYYVLGLAPLYHAQTVPVNSYAYTATVNGNDTLQNMDFAYSMTVALISGTVFFDGNQNGMQDGGEAGIAGQKINYFFGWNNYVFTDTGGHYTLTVPAGNYPVSYQLHPLLQGAWSITTPGGGALTVNADSTGVAYDDNNFGVYVDSSFRDAGLDITCFAPVPGFEQSVTMHVYNSGIFTDSVTVALAYDSLLQYTDSAGWWNWWYNDIPPLSVDTAARVITFGFVLSPGQTQLLHAQLYCPVGTAIGSSVTNTAMLAIVGNVDVNDSNNASACQKTVVASFDPNDKQVTPSGLGDDHKVHPDSVDALTYHVRFQNTGTYHATNVTILDTLDAATLDPATVSFIGSSHPCVLTISEGNVLKAHFAGIMLPDSNANEPASHGFVTFRVGLVNGLPNGTVVSNIAAIYFDYNEPVITNTTFVSLDYNLSTSELEFTDDYLLYPNPTDKQIVLSYTGNGSLGDTYSITDVTGRVLRSGVTNPFDATRIDVSDLNNGLYCINVFNDAGAAVVKRFTVLHP